MNSNEIICAKSHDSNSLLEPGVVNSSLEKLKINGWVLLRGYDVDLNKFSQLISKFCTKLTFDPAREYGNKSTQKVDAGIDAIGLHIENGNTPFPPDIIGFYSKRSAQNGSQTTLCDGAKVFEALSDQLREKFSQPLTVARTLPENLWKSYAVNEHPALNNIDEVDASHLDEILAVFPNHRGRLNDDGSLNYELDFSAVIASPLSDKKAFANAIMGPSFNYEKPRYLFKDGSQIEDQLKRDLAELSENFTIEIPWRDGDIALIDNKRVMHGRRAIIDHQNRELYIGMGLI